MNKIRSMVLGRRSFLGMGLAVVVALLIPMPHAQADSPCSGRYTILLDPDPPMLPVVVIDNDTKLTWQKGYSGLVDWQGAINYCQTLIIPGAPPGKPWRAPTIYELQTIVDDSILLTDPVTPAIDAMAFPSTPLRQFWSSSLYAKDVLQAWSVDFAHGQNFKPPIKFNAIENMMPVVKYTMNYVRCVR